MGDVIMRKSVKRINAVAVAVSVVIILATVYLSFSMFIPAVTGKSFGFFEIKSYQYVDTKDWRLLLVNSERPLPKKFSVKLKTLEDGFQVDERIYPELLEMLEDMRQDGIRPKINSAYRTKKQQKELFDNRVKEYEIYGATHEQAVKKAYRYVSKPGESEHESGLALDIGADKTCTAEQVQRWLKDNSWKYGFIMRYPATKVGITGINYEPWHYRYVGKQAAKEINSRGICLEEYLKK